MFDHELDVAATALVMEDTNIFQATDPARSLAERAEPELPAIGARPRRVWSPGSEP